MLLGALIVIYSIYIYTVNGLYIGGLRAHILTQNGHQICSKFIAFKGQNAGLFVNLATARPRGGVAVAPGCTVVFRVRSANALYTLR